MALSAFNSIGDTYFHQCQCNAHRLKVQAGLLQAGEHCLMHNYEKNEETVPNLLYLDSCFDVSLSGILSVTRPPSPS